MINKQKTIGVCGRLIGILLYILACAITFSNSFTEIATFAVVVLWLCKILLKKDLILTSVGNIGFILFLFLIVNLASFINTSYINESVRGFMKVFKHALLFFAVIDYFDSRPKVKKFLFFSIGVGAISAINGGIQYIIGRDIIRQRTIDPLDYLHRVSSSFTHANDFGAYLVVIIAIAISLLFCRNTSLKQKILLSAITLLLGWSLMATGSRGAWLGFLIAVVYLVINKSKKSVVVILLLLVISGFFMPNYVKDRFSDFAKIKERQGTVWERLKLWSGTVNMIKDHPFLGSGANTYTRNFPRYKPKDYPDVRYTHNSYLQMASEIGIVGAGTFIVFLIMLIGHAQRSIKNMEVGLDRNLLIGLLAGIVGFLFHCGVDTHFYSVTLSAFLFLYLGVAASFCDKRYENSK
jgi:hypothetical protein